MRDTARITYLSAGSSESFHADFEEAQRRLVARLGSLERCSIDGEGSASGLRRGVVSPVDRELVLGEIEQATAVEAGRAVDAAAAGFAAWRRTPWPERVEILRRAAAGISARRLELAALMVVEVGKTRIEAMAEVEESADLLTYYAGLMEAEDGYGRDMARLVESEATGSVLRPYGAWAVIPPFNFPLALAAGMVSAALVTGNTVVLKPSQDAPFSGARLAEILWKAGVPRSVLHLVFGPGDVVGSALLAHPRTAGTAFTGSWEVGMSIVRAAPREWPRPVVVEMGGKNPAIVTAAAEVEAAAEGIARSAFGFGGQKCSACSRAYVAREVAEALIDGLTARARAMVVGDPRQRDVALGPLIAGREVEKYRRWLDAIEEGGGTVLCGGRVLDEGDLARGHYVEPVVATLPDLDHPAWSEELFLPVLLVHEVADLSEGIALANRSRYGLTAGLFSRDAEEVTRFLDEIEAGVTYVNRRSGATTGAWPGVNPFGGWKASGGTGPAALGPHYLLKFLREQSRTVNEVAL
ncbi:MAG: aldehyde dehydrogenase family protein [Thermoanaerobaculia bacterium]